MLRKQANATLSFSPGWLTGRGWVTLRVGKRTVYRVVKLDRKAYRANMELQQTEPMLIARTEKYTYWQFCDVVYADTDHLSEEDVHALLVSRRRGQERRLERAKQLKDLDAQARAAVPRQTIPDDLKTLVWQRDRGACQRCAATTELQFDHVIPVSLGGATTEENLQILCGPCNRLKGASITNG